MMYPQADRKPATHIALGRALCGLMDENLLIDWRKAPHARYCHPREEHLLPLHVCAGMARTAGRLVFDDYIAGKRAVAFLWP